MNAARTKTINPRPPVAPNKKMKKQTLSPLPFWKSLARTTRVAAVPALGLALWLAASGCDTTPIPQISNAMVSANNESLVLHPGDVLSVKFRANPELDANPTIRSDGKITLQLLGEIKVSGLTPDQARQAVLEAASGKVSGKEVTVSVQSSAFIIYVTGAVARPGELVSDRPLSPFEAVIKAGFDNEKSNLAKVKIIRIDEHSKVQQKTLNLKQIITKAKDEPFTLKPFDVIYVPQKFSWF